MLINTTQSKNRIQPEVIAGKIEQEATYRAALKLVARIDEDLTRGVRHYRNRNGQLLTSLDEVVRAILTGSLLEEAW